MKAIINTVRIVILMLLAACPAAGDTEVDDSPSNNDGEKVGEDEGSDDNTLVETPKTTITFTVNGDACPKSRMPKVYILDVGRKQYIDCGESIDQRDEPILVFVEYEVTGSALMFQTSNYGTIAANTAEFEVELHSILFRPIEICGYPGQKNEAISFNIMGNDNRKYRYWAPCEHFKDGGVFETMPMMRGTPAQLLVGEEQTNVTHGEDTLVEY